MQAPAMTHLFGFRLQASEGATSPMPAPCSPGADSALSAKVGGPEPPEASPARPFVSAPLVGDGQQA